METITLSASELALLRSLRHSRKSVPLTGWDSPSPALSALISYGMVDHVDAGLCLSDRGLVALAQSRSSPPGEGATIRCPDSGILK
jgi:hypothetical protein